MAVRSVQIVAFLGSVATLVAAPQVDAQAYKVRVHADLGDLDMKIEPIAHDDVLVVRLTNRTQDKVRCDLVYDAAPQTPSRKTAYMDAGQTAESSLRAQREWFRVNVKVTCRAVEPR